MNDEHKNLMPDEYWSQFSPEDLEAMERAMADANEAYFKWDEMDEPYFERLRDRFDKGEDEIGPRKYKTYTNRYIPVLMVVMPAGKQHDGNTMVQYFHTILEDMEDGECNGAYELLTETELSDKFNIKYNN